MSRKYKYRLALLLLLAFCMIPALSFAQTETQQDTVETQIYQGDVVQFTGNITINPDEQIRGDVVAMSGNIDVRGKVYGDVTAMAGNIRLHSGSLVTGDVTTFAGNIQRDDGASVAGRITSQEGITGTGDSRFSYPYHHNYDYSFGFHHLSPWGRFSGWLISLLGLLALTAAAVAVFPKNLNAMKNSMETEPLRQLGIGLLGWAALPVVLLALVLTIIGIPVAILAAICLPVVVIIGFVVMALFAGQQLDNALGDRWLRFVDERPLIQGLKGIALIWIIKAVPLVGWLIWPLAALFGMGTALATRFGTDRPWFKSKNKDDNTRKNNDNLLDTAEQAESDHSGGSNEQPRHGKGSGISHSNRTEEQQPEDTNDGREKNDHEKEE